MTAVPQPYGTGPGVITPDGCAVDFYALMPDFGEAALAQALEEYGKRQRRFGRLPGAAAEVAEHV